MTQIRSFSAFLIRVIKIVAVLAIIGGIFVVATSFLQIMFGMPELPLPISPSDLITNPSALISLLTGLMDTDFFRISVFPGFTFVALYGAIAGLWERKLLAKMQMRVGPLYAGKVEGVLQPIADVLKLLFKELITPKGADRFLFGLVPVLTVVISTAAIAVIPVSEHWVIAQSDFGVLVIFAVLGFFPITVLITAWSSNSKFPFIGGLRALHQMVAYEIPLILSTLVAVMYSGSLNLINIVNAQSTYWFILFAPVSAIVFFICGLAEMERSPYDLPEAESEIASGWLAEYSGMNFGLILGIAVYIKVYIFSALFTIFFLGGWLGPNFLPPEFWFILKTAIVTTMILLPRGVLPRSKIDVLLRQGWARFLLLAIVNIFIAIVLIQAGVIVPGAA